MKSLRLKQFSLLVAIIVIGLSAALGYLIVSKSRALNADINGDGKVDITDLSILASNYGLTSGATFAKGDLNGDGKITISDLSILASNWGQASGFVTVCGQSLCLNGQQFIVHGATGYGTYDNPSSEISLANQAHINVLELVEFDTQYHVLADTMSTATWTRVDNYIAQAKAANLHVILNLSEYGQSLQAAGQTPTTVDWQPYLSFIANRTNSVTGIQYKNDPTIAMVELFGEIDAPNYNIHPGTEGTTAQMTAFFQRTMAEWKGLAPNILVSTGGFSYISDPNSGIDWKTIVADTNNASCDVEVNSTDDRNISVPNLSSYCQGLGKPWFLAAWSSCQGSPAFTGDLDHFIDDAAMAAHAQDMYNVDRNNAPASPGPAMAAIGSDFWNLASTPARDGNCDIGPQYPQTLSTVTNNP